MPPPKKRPPHLRPRPPSLFASRTSSGRPPNGAPTPQGYPLTAWSALLLPTTSPAAAIACTANDHGQKQMDLFKAETTWFHVFVSMIENGDVAKMGPYAVTVYLVVKAYTNWKTGKAFPDRDNCREKRDQ